jgi:hypothetical protein
MGGDMASVIYEHRKGDKLPEDAIDGMEAMLGEDRLSTDWDLDDGPPPPPGFWEGTHTRHGARIPGFTEAEYVAGDKW